MAYSKTPWKDRVVANPLTFTVASSIAPNTPFTLVPAEGAITEPGTPLTATNLNNLETQYDEAVQWVKDQKYTGAFNYAPVLSGTTVTWNGQLYKKGTFLVTVTAKYNNDGNHMAIGTWLVKYEGAVTNKIGTAELLGTIAKCGYATALSLTVSLSGIMTVTFTTTVSSTTQTIDVNAVKLDGLY
jgi:hypothetical protein